MFMFVIINNFMILSTYFHIHLYSYSAYLHAFVYQNMFVLLVVFQTDWIEIWKQNHWLGCFADLVPSWPQNSPPPAYPPVYPPGYPPVYSPGANLPLLLLPTFPFFWLWTCHQLIRPELLCCVQPVIRNVKKRLGYEYRSSHIDSTINITIDIPGLAQTIVLTLCKVHIE